MPCPCDRLVTSGMTAADVCLGQLWLFSSLDSVEMQALVAAAVEQHTAAVGAKPGPRDMGAVMKIVQGKVAESGIRADGKIVSDLVKAALAG